MVAAGRGVPHQWTECALLVRTASDRRQPSTTASKGYGKRYKRVLSSLKSRYLSMKVITAILRQR